MLKQYSFRLLSFDAKDVRETDDSVNSSNMYGRTPSIFNVQMFGISEKGKTVCINVKGYLPFFYVKVGEEWTEQVKTEFTAQMSADMGSDGIDSTRLIQRKKLYGFDGGKQYNFIQIWGAIIQKFIKI